MGTTCCLALGSTWQQAALLLVLDIGLADLCTVRRLLQGRSRIMHDSTVRYEDDWHMSLQAVTESAC